VRSIVINIAPRCISPSTIPLSVSVYHLHLITTLIRRISGRSLWTFLYSNKCSFVYRWSTRQKSMKGLYYSQISIFDADIPF
jgi:hypothetical protein